MKLTDRLMSIFSLDGDTAREIVTTASNAFNSNAHNFYSVYGAVCSVLDRQRITANSIAITEAVMDYLVK